MKYKIEDRVYFRTDDGALWLEGHENEKIILTPIVARLLNMFLQEQGKVMTRDEILSRVWEAHGLEPSSNSLNQYISVIRRNFQRFELPDNIIQTLPRIGFTLGEHVKLVRETPPDPQQNPAPPAIQNASTNGLKLIVLLFIALAIAIPFLIKGMVDKTHDELLKVEPVYVGKIDKCNLYSVAMGNTTTFTHFLDFAQKFLSQADLNCKKENKLVYFYAQNTVIHNGKGRVMVSSCDMADNKLTSCQNKIINIW